MKYYLKVEEGSPGQEIFRPEHHKIEEGEEVEVSKSTYDAHHDRDVFEARTESESKSKKNKSSEDDSEAEE